MRSGRACFFDASISFSLFRFLCPLFVSVSDAPPSTPPPTRHSPHGSLRAVHLARSGPTQLPPVHRAVPARHGLLRRPVSSPARARRQGPQRQGRSREQEARSEGKTRSEESGPLADWENDRDRFQWSVDARSSPFPRNHTLPFSDPLLFFSRISVTPRSGAAPDSEYPSQAVSRSLDTRIRTSMPPSRLCRNLARPRPVPLPRPTRSVLPRPRLVHPTDASCCSLQMLLGIEREIVIMKLIEHPNVLRLMDVWETGSELSV